MKVVVEIAGPKNESYVFGPLRTRLRGRWEASAAAQYDTSEAYKALITVCPSIPGMHVELDVESGVGRAYDPLGETDEGKALWAKIKPVTDSFTSVFGNMVPAKETSAARLDANGIKTWLHWMRRMVDGGFGRIVSGSLPDIEAIRGLPGGREVGFFSNRHRKPDERWTDTVEFAGAADAKRETAGNGGGAGAGGGATAIVTRPTSAGVKADSK